MPDTAPPPRPVRHSKSVIRRVLWVLLGGLFVVAAGAVLSAWALAGAESDVEAVEGASRALDGVLEGMVDQETGVRGFMLTGREPFLETYGPGGAAADSNRAALDELSSDQIGRLESFADLDRAIVDWRAVADEEIGLVRSDRQGDATATRRIGCPEGTVRPRSAPTCAASTRALRDIVDTRNQRQADLQQFLAIIGIAVAVLSVLVIAATVRWLRRSVTAPLAD